MNSYVTTVAVYHTEHDAMDSGNARMAEMNSTVVCNRFVLQ